MITAKEHKEKRAVLIKQAQTLDNERCKDGFLSAEDQGQFNRIIDGAQKHLDAATEILSLEGQVKSLDEMGDIPNTEPEKHGEDGAAAATGRRVYARHPVNENGNKPRYEIQTPGVRGSADYQKAFAQYLQGGATGISAEQFTTLQSDNDSAAGYLVPSEQFATGVLKDIDDLLWIRQMATIHQVPSATSLGIRKRTTRASTFDWGTELELSAQDTALKYGKKILTPHPATGLIRISRDLLRRSMIGAEAEVRSELARDGAELMEDGFLLGNGNQRPLGVFVASADGISASRNISTGNTTSTIEADNLIEVKYAIKAGYRAHPSIAWLFHRDAIKQLVKLKDGEGRYLWLTSIRENSPDMLLGIQVRESERAPSTFTTGQFVGILGAWMWYEIADALDQEVQVLMEKFADTNEVGFIERLKTDGMPTLEEAFARVTLA